jgi:hypothetical protein
VVELKVKVVRDKRTGRFVSTAAYRNMEHAAASIRKDIIASIKVSDRHHPANPGQPPHTRKRLLPRSIVYYVRPDGKYAIIGVVKDKAGTVAKAFEFGGRYKGGDYPKRPFMLPGLERGMPRFAGRWRGSIGG